MVRSDVELRSNSNENNEKNEKEVSINKHETYTKEAMGKEVRIAKNRLKRVSKKFSIMGLSLVLIGMYVNKNITKVTTEDLYVYGYEESLSKGFDAKVLAFIVDYNRENESSYLVEDPESNYIIDANGDIKPEDPSIIKDYTSLSLIIEDKGYKEWSLNNPKTGFLDYFTTLSEDDMYNLQLQAYKLGDQVALKMLDELGINAELSVFYGITPEEHYAGALFETGKFGVVAHIDKVLTYDYYDSMRRKVYFSDIEPRIDTGLNSIYALNEFKETEYKGLRKGEYVNVK